MNMVRELRIKKGINAKQLALEIGVSNATVSDWEHQRKNPTGERLKKLADYFNVDEGFILGYGIDKPNLFVPENPEIAGKSETDQIIERLLQALGNQPKTEEAKVISTIIDQQPKEEREKAEAVVRAMFSHFEKRETNDT